MTKRAKGRLRAAFPLSVAAVSLALIGAMSTALASPGGPFGVGLPENAGVSDTWLFPSLLGRIVSLQIAFNERLTGAVSALRHHDSAIWTLFGVSFLYGALHALGPGHGKAVISSYVLANRQTVRNGVLLAFLAALAQGFGAIALILVASLILSLTSVAITQVTFQLQIGSDILIVFLGCWLVLTRLARLRRRGRMARENVASSKPTDFLRKPPVKSRFVAFDPTATTAQAMEEPCGCGQLHIPDSCLAEGRLDFRKAWSVIASTAMRPCTGALIVLVFAMSRGVVLAGVGAAMAMSFGTAVSVSTLAATAASVRGAAVRFAGEKSRFTSVIGRIVEIFGSFAILIFGLSLLFVNLTR